MNASFSKDSSFYNIVRTPAEIHGRNDKATPPTVEVVASVNHSFVVEIAEMGIGI